MGNDTIHISKNTTLNKNERLLVNKILYLSQLNKIAETTLDDKEISLLTRVKKEKIDKFLNNLASKIIRFTIHTDTDVFELNTNIFSYLKTHNLYVFVMSSILFNSIDGDDFFSKYKIQYFLMFKQKKSYKLYDILMNSHDSIMILSIDFLKKLLADSENRYDRFFDFEKNILAPITNDINQNSNIVVNYSKKRDGKFIKDITFHIQKTNNNPQVINDFFQLFHNNFANTDQIVKRIYFLLDYFSYEELLKSFHQIYLETRKNPFNQEDIMNYLSITHIKETLKPKLIVKEKFDTAIKLLQKLNNEIQKLDLPVQIHQNFYPPEFLTLIYSNTLKDYDFKNDYIHVNIHYVPKKESIIIINTLK